jgi:malate dehydrogenase
VKRGKVAIFGAGGTGAETAKALLMHEYEEIALIDVAQGLAMGKALDISQCGVLLGKDLQVTGGSDAALCQAADVVVITAGLGRRPGLNREQLLGENATTMRSIAKAIKTYAPNAHVIVLTNPADLLTRVVYEETGFPAHRVIGQGGILDSARLQTFVATELGVSGKDVRAMVLGGHGDAMVPVKRFTSVRGIPVEELMTEETWAQLVHRTRFGGGEILGHFQTHGAAVTPGFAVAEMVEALSSDTPRIMPISTKSNGHYGLPADVFVGLPAVVSNQGVLRILDVTLDAWDHAALLRSSEELDRCWQTQ